MQSADCSLNSKSIFH